jgi:Fe-S-cluster containining protein
MDTEPWYHAGLRFSCTGCGACCTGAPGHVWVNKEEIQAMAAAVGLEVAKFEKQYVRQVGIRKSLRELPNGDCIFFDNLKRNCRVYEVRPRQCRTWPFWASNLRSPQAWQEMARQCPGADQGPLIPLGKIQSLAGVIDV